MIKRENIKQAIDAISKRDPEIGYSLNEMLGTGQIDVSSISEDPSQGDDLHFFFNKEKVSINKFLYFNEGIVPLEQGLVIKYGEMTKKQELLKGEDSIDYLQASKTIRKAGLKFMVIHEIDYAIKRLRRNPVMPETNTDLENDNHNGEKRAPSDERLVSLLEEIKQDTKPLEIPGKGDDPAVLFQGIINGSTPACFVRFPFRMDSLMQIADMNLEFFHVRFLLNCLARGMEKNLFVCLADGKILGLVYLALKEHMFIRGLEIKYIATLRGKTDEQMGSSGRVPRGVGAFLVAGVWLLLKAGPANIREIILDSEIGARGFYEAAGFQSRGLSEYVLKVPKGRLLKAIIIMANNLKDLGESAVSEIKVIIEKQIKGLRKKPKNEKKVSARKLTIDSVKECLKADAHQELAGAAMDMLMKYNKKIPESEELIQFASEYGSDETKAHI